MMTPLAAGPPCARSRGASCATRPLSALRRPTDGEVHLHWANLSDDGRSHADLCTPDELARAARFRFHDDRSRYLVGRAFMRAVLGRYLDLPAKEIRFTYSQHGKPELDSHASLRFNFSHSGQLALLGVSAAEIGVDIEHVRPMPELESIARAFFSAADTEYVLAAHGAQRLSNFYRCWTRNEAITKSLGEGLGRESWRSQARSVGRWSIISTGSADLSGSVAVRHDAAWIGNPS